MRFFGPLVLCLAMPAVACKLKSASATKEAGSAAAAGEAFGGLVPSTIKKSDVPVHVRPGDLADRFPDNIKGTWWADSDSIGVVVTFKHAAWDEAARTLSQPVTAFETYATGGPSSDRLQDAFLNRRLGRNYGGFELTFDESGRVATVRSPYIEDKGGRTKAENAAQLEAVGTLTWQSDGDWLFQGEGIPDYHLRRIVNADTSLNQQRQEGAPGAQESPYDAFLKDRRMGDRLTVNKIVQQIPEVGGSVTISLDPSSPATYVGLDSPDNRLIGTVTVKAPAQAPVRLWVQPDLGGILGGDGSASKISGDFGTHAAIAIQPAATGVAGDIEVTFTPTRNLR